MANNIAVSITADVADLQVKRAIMSAELRTARTDLNDLAKAAAASGMSEMTPDMLAAGDAVARLTNQIRGVDSELKGLTGGVAAQIATGNAFVENLQEQAATLGMTQRALMAYRAEKLGVSERAAPHLDALEDYAAQTSARAAEEARAASVDRLVACLREEIATSGMSRSELVAYQAAQLGAAEAVTPLVARLAEKNAALRDERAADAQAASGKAFIATLQEEIATLGLSQRELRAYQAEKLGVSQLAAPHLATIDEHAAQDSAREAEEARVASVDRLVASLKDEISTTGLTREELAAYRAAQLDATEAVAPHIAALKERKQELADQQSADAKAASGRQFIATLQDEIETLGLDQRALQAYKAEKLGVAAQAAPLLLEKDNRTQRAGAESFLAGLQREATTAKLSRTELLQLQAAEHGVVEEAAPLIAALGSSEKGMVSSRAATESLVLVHEALSGNYHRMAGSLMIEAQAFAGTERSAAAFGAILSPMGLAVAAGTAVMVAGVVAAAQYESGQERLITASVGVASASGLTAQQLEAAGSSAADWSGRSVAASTEAAEGFAGAGIRSQAVISQLAGDVEVYAALTGQKAADAQKALADAMHDPVKAAELLHQQLGILDAAQLQQIATMTAQGDRTQAVSIIMEAFQHRIDEAKAAGIGADGVFGEMGSAISNIWGQFGKAVSIEKQFAETLYQIATIGPQAAFAINQVARAQGDAAVTAQRHAARDQRLNDASESGGRIADATPENQDAARKQDLVNKIAVLNKAIAAETQLHHANSAAVQRDKAALQEYTRARDTFLGTAEKAHQIAGLDAQIATARHNHDRDAVADLTRRRAQLNTAGEVMSAAQATQQAIDASEVAEDRTNAPKGRQVDVVSKWQEDLRAQQVASADYFRDQTADELKFWQGKLGLVTKGSHDWIEVQGHIYEASRTLAHQDYDEHLAALNEKIAADRGSWTKEQADWAEKLAFIKSKYGEQPAEYKRALAEMDNATREHDKQELADTERHIRESTQLLKTKLDAQAQIRESAAHSQETVVRDDAAGSPLGEIAAAARVGAINAQLNQAKLADLDAFHAAETAQIDAAIKSAASLYNGDRSQYQALIDAKTKADQDYANKKAELDAKTRQQSIQDILAVKSAYHSYADSLVGSAVSGLDGALSKQKSWAQAGIGIYQELAHRFEQQIEKMLASWVVKHLLMSSAQRAQLAVQQGAQTAANASQTAIMIASSKTQVAALAGVAGAGGVASMAAAPFPIDLGAPAFGAQMAAAAVSLGSFAVGTNVVPADMIAQIHAGERIIPAADNRELMSAVKGGGGGGKGDMHLTYAPQLNADTPSFRDQLHGHKDELLGMLRGMMRNGALRAA